MLKRLMMLCGLLAGLAAVAADSVKTGYQTPVVVVPYAWQKPKLDGVVDDAEWQGAASVNALQTTNHQVSPRQTRFWILWDEETLYLAMRSPLRPGERVVQALRKRDRDINVVFDDSYEIWLDVGTKTADGQPCFFQFLCNYAGARYDVLHEPAVGNSRLGWSSGWEPRNRITPDGKAWEWELAVPRQSVQCAAPLADGFRFTCRVARNFKRPWEQNSFEGTSSFAVRESHSHFVLSKTAPAVQLLAAADPKAQTFGLQVAACGQREEPLKWVFESDGGVKKEGEFTIKKGQLTAGPADLGLDKPGPGSYRIRVLSADGQKTYLDWCALRAFGDLKILDQAINDPGDQVGLTLEFNPVRDYLRVSGDFIGYDARAQIAKYQVAVLDAAGKALAEKELKLDALAYVEGVLKLPPVTNGDYTAKLTCLGADGKMALERESKFTKKDPAKEFPWWNTTAGNIEKVIAPWEPVGISQEVLKPPVAAALGTWGRTMYVGPAGLPAGVVSQHQPLLAAPSALVAQLADGRRVTAEGADLKFVTQQPHRYVVDVTSRLDTLAVSSRVTIEFDGMYKVEMKLTPQQPLAVKSLKVVVPLANPVADYLHAAGEGIRYGFFYGFLPHDQQGRIWDCLTVDSQPMLVGSFIPYLWVGNPKGGLCWFADSDEGWVPNGQVPAIEVRRDSPASTDLVLNLISSDFVIDQPRTITFAFQATPVKPMHAGWRMDTWWCGDTFRDYTCSGDIIWTARPFTLDPAKCKQMVDAQHQGMNGFIFGVNKYHANAVPYFIHQSLPAHLIPEVKYFGDEWRTSISEGLYYGQTLTDYMIYNLHNWAKTTGIDGYYIDNMRPLACDNIEAGRGYRLPDGRVQPTYQMFDTRKYFLRMRAAFLEGVGHSKIVLHMTNNMIIPWVGPADVAYDGEHHVIYPELQKDFMDFWTLERLRSDYSSQWGVAVNFMHEYQGNWDRVALVKAMRAYTGAIILHDALPSGNSNGLNTPVWIGRDRFGIEAADVEFIPYWDSDQGISCAAKDVRIAAWKRPGKVLLTVTNWGEETTAEVKLAGARLGLPDAAKWTVTDAEAGTTIGKDWSAAAAAPVTLAGDTLKVPVARHDYRQVIVEQP